MNRTIRPNLSTGPEPGDSLVDAAVPIAVRDHGGPADAGAPILLLHGLGGNLLHWVPLVPRLTAARRVLAMDLRGHGHSGDGPWHWEAVLEDVEAVVAHLGLPDPVVVGHSLGGAVATRWALRHPDGPGAVNLDMLRGPETDLDNYVGMDRDRAREARAALSAFFTAQTDAMAGPLSAEALEGLREQQRQFGGAAMVEAFERNLRTVGEATSVRPGADLLAEARVAVAEDMFQLFAKVRCPHLVCCATIDVAQGPQFDELMAAYRRGIERDIAGVEAINPNVRFVAVSAGHAMIAELPDELAELILDFSRR